MASTLSTFAGLMKTKWTPDKVQDLVSRERPTMAKLLKSTEFYGDSMKVPVITATPQGIASQSLAIAQAAASNVGSLYFLLTTADYFGSVSLGSKVLMASRNNMGAFVENKKAEFEYQMEGMADNMHNHLWGNGGGKIARRASQSGAVITLSEKSEVAGFHLGMQIVASDGDGTGGSDAIRSGVGTVTAINTTDGTVTYSGTITSIADNDYLFRYGDFVGATGTNILKGFPVYITATDAPAALYGMTRTSAPNKLAGCRVTATEISGKNSEQRIKILGAAMAGRHAAKVGSDAFMNPEDWQTLEQLLSSRGVRALEDTTTKFGFLTLNAAIGGTNVRIYADRMVPKGVFWMLNMKHWKLWSMGELIHIVNQDGNTILRNSTTNDFELRLESFPVLACDAPLHNGRVSLT